MMMGCDTVRREKVKVKKIRYERKTITNRIGVYLKIPFPRMSQK